MIGKALGFARNHACRWLGGLVVASMTIGFWAALAVARGGGGSHGFGEGGGGGGSGHGFGYGGGTSTTGSGGSLGSELLGILALIAGSIVLGAIWAGVKYFAAREARVVRDHLAAHREHVATHPPPKVREHLGVDPQAQRKKRVETPAGEAAKKDEPGRLPP